MSTGAKSSAAPSSCAPAKTRTAVIERVKAKIAQIAPSLPPGVTIKPFYDRSELIDRTIDTLKHALTEEIILVTLAHIIFLFHFRSILIVTLPLPVSILISFILMRQFGITSQHHVAHRHRHRHRRAGGCGHRDDGKCHPALRASGGEERRARSTRAETWRRHARRLQASRPPDLLRDGDHHPRLRAGVRAHRAGRKTVPSARLHQDLRDDRLDAAGGHDRARALQRCWCAGRFIREDRNIVMRLLLRDLRSGAQLGAEASQDRPRRARRCCSRRRWSSRSACRARAVKNLRDARLAAHGDLAQGFGKEFMPPLNEGSLLFMPVLLPKTGLTEVKRIMAWQDRSSRRPRSRIRRRQARAASKPPPIPRRSR